MGLGKRIERVLPDIQPRVEDMLEVELGDIEVLPLRMCRNEILDSYGSDYVSLPVRVTIYSLSEILELFANAKAGESAIYFTRSPLSNLLISSFNVERMTSHELAHTACAKLFNKPLYGKDSPSLPQVVWEGFAEHVARSVMYDKYGKPYEKMVCRFLRTYERKVGRFRRLLDENGVESNRDLVDFVRSLG